MKHQVAKMVIAILIGLSTAFFLPLPVSATPMKEVRRVLILNDFGRLASPGIAAMDQALYDGLHQSPYQIELYDESLETILFSDEASQREIRESYIRKYQARRPDLIIPVGPASLRFMIESHQRFFPDIPVVFCGTTEAFLRGLKLDGHFTGAWSIPKPEKTLEAAFRMLPKTRRVVVVGGVGVLDRDSEALARESFHNYESKAEFSYLTDLEMSALLERLRDLPADTIVFHTAMTEDVSGARFIDATQSVPMIAGAASAPVFVFDDVDVRGGSVGGYVLSWAAQGQVAGRMAARILNGERPQDIPVAQAPNSYLFDWQALQRWRIRESDLPPGSAVVNRQFSVWGSYKRYIVSGLALIFVELFLVIELLWSRAKLERTENELVLANNRLRLAWEAGRTVGWDWNVTTGQDQWFGDLQTMFGISSNHYSGRVEDFHKRVHPEDRELVGKAVAEARFNRESYFAEFRVVRTDGSVRWVEARGEFHYGTNNEAVRMVGTAVDITDRKQIAEALRISEEKFSRAFRRSPMLLTITSAVDNRYIEVNETFERVTGWSRDEVIGRTPFDIGIWDKPEQRARVPKALLSGDVVQNIQFEARLRNGDKRAIMGSAELIHLDGELCVICVAADITDLKRAEATLRESEQRFRLVANTAPVKIWMSGADGLYTYFNRRWLEFTGRWFDEEKGNGWVQGVHPDDIPYCLDVSSKAFERRKSFQREYRLRRSDGEYRWLLESGVPRFDEDGSFLGYIGSAVDTTQLKQAEEALSKVSGNLIRAQEEERARIARELHDDISQRLSVLVLNLQRLRRGHASDLDDGIGKAIQLALDITSDTQALSHRLHSSKLEYLGLSSAAAGYCEELSLQRDVEISIETGTLPGNLPLEISLCVFRVLQEALQNAIKHSASRRFEVSLRSESNQVLLTVQDWGKGFDSAEAMTGRGLGLSSMKERLKLVDGRIRIESAPTCGTRIEASVPLGSKIELVPRKAAI